MKKYSGLVLHLILVFGLLCVLFGLALLLCRPELVGRKVLFVWPLILLLIGGALLYFAFGFTHYAHQVFLGLNFCFGGFLLAILRSHEGILTLHTLWPLAVVFCSFSLIISGYFRYRRFRTAYLFPAILMMVLGGFFCLFSFRIIKMPLREFVTIWWPFILILLGCFLLGVFFYQQHNRTAFPYMTDESVDDTDSVDEFSESTQGDLRGNP
ncbi:MAG: hypothetical protein K6E51_11945 [Treponema sp.]|nr:hypothetical protein [Treponema sp.]